MVELQRQFARNSICSPLAQKHFIYVIYIFVFPVIQYIFKQHEFGNRFLCCLISFVPVIYNFEHVQVQQTLHLDVGETVQVLEECSG